jgi:hypothetical protein
MNLSILGEYLLGHFSGFRPAAGLPHTNRIVNQLYQMVPYESNDMMTNCPERSEVSRANRNAGNPLTKTRRGLQNKAEHSAM